jgi:ABC-2 type transport system ATP-binding protein
MGTAGAAARRPANDSRRSLAQRGLHGSLERPPRCAPILLLMSQDATVIRVDGLEKTFRIPHERTHTLKERALHPFRRRRFNELNVLRDISFDVAQGEFFGIVGRNGSGKSTLLKCMAGIYGADAGTIHVAGRLSPFIELGVGFNPDLPARDNVEINAVMMGLNPRMVRERFDDIIAFGGLEGFVDQKLKNYSSGMQVRLAFSVMVHSDPDVMLIDEVLAVGDAAFQQKCLDVFYRLKSEGKTIVLVTHAMGLVEQFCDRAMMLSDGDIKLIGEPHEVGRAYLTENFRTTHSDLARHASSTNERVRLLDAWVTNGEGERVDAIEYRDEFTLHMEVEALEPIVKPGIAMWVTTEAGVRVFSAGARENEGVLADLRQGEVVEFSLTAVNPLSAGRYHVGCTVVRGSAGLDILLHQDRATDVVSYGADLVGLIGVDFAGSLTRKLSGEAIVR